ncbi:MAG: hypothetical protein GY866_11540 [Proteobacteria bacterium]|nr:hypothetical protein [Pseudomonadota bacterium]
MNYAKTIAVGLISLFLLLGCSTLKIGYDYADWFIVNEIDDMFDLNGTQKTKVNDVVDKLHHWHRTEEIPRIVAFLGQARGKAATEVKKEDIEWLFSEFDAMKARIVDQVADDVSILLTTLTDDQIDHLEISLVEHNEEEEDEFATPLEEWEERQKERFIEKLNDWFGDLGPQQEKDLLAAYEVNRATRLRYHVQSVVFQKNFVALLRRKPPALEIKHTLRQWILEPESLVSNDYAQFRDRQKERRVDFYLVLDRSITETQRQTAQQKLLSYQYDFEAIYTSSL